MTAGNPPMVPPEVAEQHVGTVGFWDVQIRTVLALAQELNNEYTSKPRLRQIAQMYGANLLALLEAAKQSEQAEQEQPKSNLILPEQGLVTP